MRRTIPGFGDNRFRNAVIFVGVVFVAVLLIGGGRQLGGSSPGPDDYPEYLDELRQQFQPDVTVTRLVDPWLPPFPDEPPPATRRLVALEVTIEYPDERRETHSVSSSYFQLIDSQDFVYGATPTRSIRPFAKDLSWRQVRGPVVGCYSKSTRILKSSRWHTRWLRCPCQNPNRVPWRTGSSRRDISG